MRNDPRVTPIGRFLRRWSIDELVRLDFLYLERWSVFLDLSIMLKTIPAVLRAKGAW
jgi:lipopolysaccharide/colanic/teichoic acid biosynthesis glycosyltransferase